MNWEETTVEFTRIDFSVLIEVLLVVTVLSFLIERALAIVFEHQVFVKRFSDKGLKEPIALLVCFGVVRYFGFDALATLFQRDEPSLWGYLLTAAIIAGGSKGSVKLFQDVLGIKSSAEKERAEQKKQLAQPGDKVVAPG